MADSRCSRTRALVACGVVVATLVLGACTPAKKHAPHEPENPALLASQLAAARVVALAHPTAADAVAAGYGRATTYITKIAAHYLKPERYDRVFRAGEPEVLLYDGDLPSSRIVGAAYLSDIPLPGFAGPHDHWHHHPHLCTDLATGLIIAAHITEAECVSRGGLFSDGLNLWMLHAWVVPGFESPAGVFSERHPLLP